MLSDGLSNRVQRLRLGVLDDMGRIIIDQPFLLRGSPMTMMLELEMSRERAIEKRIQVAFRRWSL